jgi:hypothetical protein
MSVTLNMSQVTLAGMQRLLEANQSIGWRVIALDGPGALDTLAWCDLEPKVITPLLKAYQRLVRILPVSEEHRALPLLESGLHSAIQIANLSQDEFAHRWATLFPGEAATGEAVHRNAIARRSTLLLHHINTVQTNEPHYRAARFK